MNHQNRNEEHKPLCVVQNTSHSEDRHPATRYSFTIEPRGCVMTYDQNQNYFSKFKNLPVDEEWFSVRS